MDDDLLDEIMGINNNNNNNGLHYCSNNYSYLSDDDLLYTLENNFNEHYNEFNTYFNDEYEKELKNIIICSGNSNIFSSNKNNYIYQIKNPETNKYYFCCLCGKLENEHNKERHNFFAAFDEHQCIKCKKFFFEHRNIKGCNWVPTKFL